MTTETFGLVLAGGLARRMGGGDKPMRTIAGKTILDRVIARLEPQCDGLILNANGDPARFAAFKLPVIADGVADFPGPLAGILAGLDWMAANRPDVKWMLSAAGDCPFLPRDLVARHNAECANKAQLFDFMAPNDLTRETLQGGSSRDYVDLVHFRPPAGLWLLKQMGITGS